ncbi:MAG: hypothetical protein OEV66_04305 [Spirochaetia bacterium]|nr:hypothetical protein [Spirochaetia bacterium]
MCQKCHKIVDKVYQKGYCKKCLVEYFKGFQSILNNNHPLKPVVPKKTNGLIH